MRASTLAIAGLAVLVFSLPSAARADEFDDLAGKASLVATAEQMQALLWSQSADCKSKSNDLLKRQCAGLRAQQSERVAHSSYLVDVDARAIEVVADEKMMTVNVRLRSCLWCGESGPLVLGRGAHKSGAGGVMAAVVGNKEKIFKKKARFTHWLASIAPRLRGQFVVRVPSKGEHFSEAGREGFKLEVLGYRMYDPCQGFVLAASPASEKGLVDESACQGTPFDDSAKTPKKAVAVLPSRLSPSQIKTAMRALSKQTQACFAAYRIEGKAIFKIVIAGDGSLVKADQSGAFSGTPTGACLDKAIKSATFPKSNTKATRVTYPIVLR